MQPTRETDSADDHVGMVAPEWVEASPGPPVSPYEWIQPVRPYRPGTDLFAEGMRDVGRRLRAANVAAIYLIHGTFVGHDPWGMYASLAGPVPGVSSWLRRETKRAIDRFMGDTANYTDDYARLLQESLGEEGEDPIPVRRFVWCSENNHIGRADGAVNLIDELASQDFAPGQRVLFWAHSHGGNVLAMMTHLLSADADVIDRFFAATSVYYGSCLRPNSESKWGRVRQLLKNDSVRDDKPAFLRRPESKDAALANTDYTALDMVTFGMPIRYNWNPRGYDRLLHVINHSPQPGRPVYQSALPRHIGDVFQGSGGDYVQQVAVEGTNFLPLPWRWRAWLADLRLAKMISPDVHLFDLPQRIKTGLRVASDGTTLLVDYGREPSRWIQHMAGHSVYTRADWMLFHAEQVARCFYSTQ